MVARFRQVAGQVLGELMRADPAWATSLGDHRFDDRLADFSPDGTAERAHVLVDALGALDEIDDAVLSAPDRVDLDILRSRVAADLWRLTELRPHEWDPLAHLPGDALYGLIVRDALPPADRLVALAERFRAVPGALATARATLHGMPRVHVETAITRVRGTLAMLGAELDALVEREPRLRAETEAARATAADALDEHLRWLEGQVEQAAGDSRLGTRDYAAQLWYTLDSELSPDALLTRAESDLIAVEEELTEAAAEYAGRRLAPDEVRGVLDGLAADAPSGADTVLPLCREALADATRRITELDLVTIPDEQEIAVGPMPEAHRGVATAYCDPPGPLESAPPGGGRVPMLVAVAPPPDDWPAERAASYYREYNGHLLRDTMVHEAMPGHAVQLGHAARYRGATPVRAALRNGAFVEGWAVYAEELVDRHGWCEDRRTALAFRLMRLKMLLRSTINAILDVRVHCFELTEAEAMELMIQRGHQEEAAAVGKWRRALLTSAQLATYYVGHREVRGIAAELRAARPSAAQREIHDAMLAHGSPPTRHLRGLLGLDQP
nr:DUF885 domain-containing protein [Allonocardiopsis opalescens]